MKMFTKATQLFLNSGSAPQAVLAAQLLANQIASQQLAERSRTNYHGRLIKTSKRQPYINPASLPQSTDTRQSIRAEARREIKAMDARAKERARRVAALDLSKRINARELQETDRRDNRLGVHAIIERGRCGVLSRRNFS
jgi:hypothetical protein